MASTTTKPERHISTTIALRTMQRKSPLRVTALLHFGAVYGGVFFISGILSYVQHESVQSDVLTRYFNFLLQHQVALTLALSTVGALLHYQTLAVVKVEAKCRLLVGDRMPLIRIRYFLSCFLTLTICFMVSTCFHLILGYSLDNSAYLFVAFLSFIVLSSALLRTP